MGEEAGFMLDEGNEGAETETSQKAFRRRKKQLYQSVRKQMEFYFSDSNLTKDRFLGNLLKEDPYVDLSVFIRFNRIRALTTDISEIAKALRHSELLSVTEDGTKVFRTKPVQQKDNIDECTIYVEQLPPDADHDWLRDVFSAYGNVAYVSIPKYRTSGKIKGFGFVEFETPEEVNKTLEAFGARGCRLSSEIAPDKLCSIATFEDETTKVHETNQGELSEKEDKKQQTAEKDSSQHKRKRSSSLKESIKDLDSEQVSENEAKSTQNKEQIFSEENVKESTKEGEDCIEENSDVVKRKRAKSQDEKGKFAKKDENEKLEETSSNIKRKRKKHPEEEVEDEEIDLEASKRRRKLIEEQDAQEESTKKKRKKKQEVDAIEDQESEDNIASKRIKDEVIESEDAAPENTKLDQPIKKKRKREAEEETRENTTEEDEQVTESRSQYLTEGGEIENDEGESKRKRKRKKKKNKKDKQDMNANSLQILSKREWKRLRNKYLDLQRAKMKCLKQYLNKQYWNNEMQQCNTDIPEPEVKVSQPRISYTSGVIVYAVLDEAITDIRKFKADTKALQYVEYVDVLPGANTAYIRCSTAEGAKQLASSNPWVSSEVLKGEEETEYWDKIMADRKVKFSNKIRTKQRGRDKVLRRAERELGKHIKFDE